MEEKETVFLRPETWKGMDMSPEIGDLAAALAKAQGEMGGAKRNKDNPYHHSTYADLASGWDACREALSKHDIAVFQPTEIEDGGIVVVTLLVHGGSGQWMKGRLLMVPVRRLEKSERQAGGTDCVRTDDPQAVGSAITYGRRYGLFGMVGLAPEDDDANAASGRSSSGSSSQKSPSKNTHAGSKQTTRKGYSEAALAMWAKAKRRFPYSNDEDPDEVVKGQKRAIREWLSQHVATATGNQIVAFKPGVFEECSDAQWAAFQAEVEHDSRSINRLAADASPEDDNAPF